MRNIKLAYIISFLNNSWFWIPIWVLYYLRYTNYAGIGLIESVMIVTSTMTEIPTGAIADLLGKKKTLLLSFVFRASGTFLMGVAPSFGILASSVFIMTIGSSLYSGTMEALVYDSLKEKNKESLYDRVIANISSIQLLASAFASIIGGFLYTISPGLPFFVLGIFLCFAFLMSLFIKEPRVDTEKFSFSQYIFQLRSGFGQLFDNPIVKRQVLILLTFGIILVITYEALSDILLIEFGFKAQQIGVLMAIIYFTCAISSQLTPYFTKKFGEMKSILLFSGIGSFTLILAPFVTMFFGGLVNVLRASAGTNYDNVTSVVLNKNIDSKYRATTLSTFFMMQKLPYLLLAYPLGTIMDAISARHFAFILGTFMMLLIGVALKITPNKLK